MSDRLELCCECNALTGRFADWVRKSALRESEAQIAALVDALVKIRERTGVMHCQFAPEDRACLCEAGDTAAWRISNKILSDLPAAGRELLEEHQSRAETIGTLNGRIEELESALEQTEAERDRERAAAVGYGI